MKNTKVCPKCGGQEIAVMRGKLDTGYGSRLRGRRDNPYVDRYLCCACGYLESWMDLEAFTRMGAREYWEKLRLAEESDRRFGADLAYYSERARQEREQSVKAPQETKKKRREDPWT